jgi:hypothetical protein
MIFFFYATVSRYGFTSLEPFSYLLASIAGWRDSDRGSGVDEDEICKAIKEALEEAELED